MDTLSLWTLFGITRLAEGHILFIHFANTPMQNTAIFHGCKNVKFSDDFLNIFLIFAQNIDCWVHVRTASMRRF